MIGYTKSGLGTLKHYSETKNRFLDSDLDSRYFRRAIKRTQNRKLTGYCEQQGMYLAAKELGILDDFMEAKKQSSNCIIPNF